MQREKPIIFNSEMIKAILDDRKTQTRRIVKPQPIYYDKKYAYPERPGNWWWKWEKYGTIGFVVEAIMLNFIKSKSLYKVGDLLYVRETWQAGIEWDDVKPSEIDPLICSDINYIANSRLAADDGWGKCRPSIFMPKWATRIWLEVTKVRVERIQSIITKDILAEGIIDQRCGADGLMCDFAELWNSINKKRGYGWEKNPWCWVYDFKRINK